MLKAEIKVGGVYLAKVSGKITKVRVDSISEVGGQSHGTTLGTARKARAETHYGVTNLATGRRTTFRSAAKFRSPAQQAQTLTPEDARAMLDTTPGGERDSEQMAEKLAESMLKGEFKVEGMVDSGGVLRGGHEALRQMEEGAKPPFPPAPGTAPATPSTSPTSSPDGVGVECVESAGEGELSEEQVRLLGTEHRVVAPEEVPALNAEYAEDEALGRGSGLSPEVAEALAAIVNDPTPTATLNSLKGLASRIAATLASRRGAVGSPVAGMTPNAEQEAILAAALDDGVVTLPSGQRVLVVCAGAGSGKTATCKMLEEVLPGRGQYTAFNSSLVNEARSKFKRAAVNTTHSLAFRAVGRAYQHRLDGRRMRSSQVAQILGITDQYVTLEPYPVGSAGWLEAAQRAGYGEGSPPPADFTPAPVKQLRAEFLAGQVMAAVRRFCQSADPCIDGWHFPLIPGIDSRPPAGAERDALCAALGLDVGVPDELLRDAAQDAGRHYPSGHDNSDKLRGYLVPFARRYWDDMMDARGQLPFTHDVYVKLWQLGTGQDRPIIACDYLLLDEGQDTAPVFLDIVRQQTHALVIIVGDNNQAIYEWRGAVDALAAFPGAPRRLLSQSYRFGQAVADVANAVLATLDAPTDLVMRGNPALDSKVEAVAEPRCYLYRTNAGAIGRVMAAAEEGKLAHLIFGSEEAKRGLIGFFSACLDLQARPPRRTDNPELAAFEDWAEVQEYSKSDEGSDLRLMVKLVDTFGAQAIRDILRDMPEEEDADLVVGTAHRSKGREWDSVKLGGDFPLANKMLDSDRRLLYVAATRARMALDITECPPFCGGQDGRGEDARWVPGIEIKYTTPTATTGEVERTTPTEILTNGAKSQSAEVDKEDAEVACTYAKLRDGTWGLRATAPIKTGDVVTVTTRSGQRKEEVVGRIVWVGNGVWLAAKDGGNGK